VPLAPDDDTSRPVVPAGLYTKSNALPAVVPVLPVTTVHVPGVPALNCEHERALPSSDWQAITLFDDESGSDFRLRNLTCSVVTPGLGLVVPVVHELPVHLAYAALFCPLPESTSEAPDWVSYATSTESPSMFSRLRDEETVCTLPHVEPFQTAPYVFRFVASSTASVISFVVGWAARCK
jgi:hypothetical protein